jgi:hypothetical protein
VVEELTESALSISLIFFAVVPSGPTEVRQIPAKHP